MKSILLIEDDSEIAEKLLKEFEENNVETIYCPDKESAEKAIQGNLLFDAVILDWFFEGDSSDESLVSKLLFKKLNGLHFRPVFVYTNNKSDFEETPQEEIGFPENLITCYSKEELSHSELKEKISELLSDNISLQLADTYRQSLHSTLEKILFELNDLPGIDIKVILNKIYGDGENVDWSNDLILNLLHRSLLSTENFISRLTILLKKINGSTADDDSEKRRKIANKILYYKSSSEYIRNGDIISVEKADKTVLVYGIVVTPDCDLEQKNTRYIELIELREIEDKQLDLTSGQKESIKSFNNPSLYYFPSVNINNKYTDFVAVLKSKFILLEAATSQSKYPKASERLLYSMNYIYNAVNIKINLICSKTNPYKAEFLQKLHTNNSRVGIPDIKDLF
jgi:hypothetical protein